jgi:hypothetical protein
MLKVSRITLLLATIFVFDPGVKITKPACGQEVSKWPWSVKGLSGNQEWNDAFGRCDKGNGSCSPAF